MQNDLYISLGYLIVIGFALTLTFLVYKKFEISVVVFTIAAFASSMFYDNNPVWINEEIETGIGGYLRGLILIFSGFMGTVYFLKNYKLHQFKVPIHILLLILFAFYSVISVFYSIDFNSTLVRSGLFASLTFFMLGLNFWLNSKNRMHKFLNILFLIITVLLFINIFIMFAFPTRAWWWQAPSRFLGLSSNPNELGGFCAISFPIILWKLYNSIGYKKLLTISILLLNTLIIFATGSRTSIIVSLIGILIWLFVYKDWLKIAILMLFIAAGIFIISQNNVASFERNEGAKITDLTERELIWQGASKFLFERPVLGYGYAVQGEIFANQNLFDMTDQFFNPNSQQPLHNGYLEIFIGGGIIGFSFWLIILAIPIFYAMKTELSSFKAYTLATMLPILISNIVESALTGYLSATDLYFWFAWVVAGNILFVKNLD